MTFIDITELLQSNESQTIEYREEIDAEVIGTTICAFLNTTGGKLLLGINQEEVISEIAEETIQNLEDELNQHLSPAATWAILPVELKDQKVYLIDVPRGPTKPYMFDGVIYIRSGSSNKRASAEELHKIIDERILDDQLWERRPAMRGTMAELDQDELQKTITESTHAGRLDSSVTDPLSLLRKLHLITEERVLQACVVAFIKDALPWYPQCSLRMARFRGTTKDEFLDQKKVAGNAFYLLEEANIFLQRHLSIQGSFFSNQLRRQDSPLYPPMAIREALINAICHRDYSIAGGAISLAMYDDRLEIASTGTLPQGLSVEDLKKSHYSMPRNPLLADVFYRRGLIELWGRGTQKMLQLSMEAGSQEPQFEQRAGEFIVRFFSPSYTPPVSEGFDLTERQRRIIHLLREGQAQFGEIKRLVAPDLSDTALRNDLKALRELGIIHSKGSGRGTRWLLSKD